MVDMVDEGVDLALRMGRITDSNLIVRRLRHVHLVVCATPAYWAQRGLPQHPDDLADHDALTYSLADGSHPEWRFLVYAMCTVCRCAAAWTPPMPVH